MSGNNESINLPAVDDRIADKKAPDNKARVAMIVTNFREMGVIIDAESAQKMVEENGEVFRKIESNFLAMDRLRSEEKKFADAASDARKTAARLEAEADEHDRMSVELRAKAAADREEAAAMREEANRLKAEAARARAPKLVDFLRRLWRSS